MGAQNDAMLSYLEDSARFADLFNQAYFGGEQVVEPEELSEASEAYRGGKGEGQRFRDIKKRLKSGKELKILAVEAQNDVNYAMPWRIMDYDCREYGRQIKRIQGDNRRAEKAGGAGYANAGERLGKVRKEERIAPVYTLCVYHGTEDWDGPRSLRDMMDFGENLPEAERRRWEEIFADYPMRLLCVNEPMDCSGFRTSLKELFSLLPYRSDMEKMRQQIWENPAYRSMDEETAQMISIMIGAEIFMENKNNYKEGDGYNMCKALKDMVEQGEAKVFTEIIDHIMKNQCCSLEKACQLAGKTVEEYNSAKALCQLEPQQSEAPAQQ